MYESYWQLLRKPFECGIDSAAYYPSEAHQAALLKLRYAIDSRLGGALLTGGSGCGKTLLVRLLAERLEPEFAPFIHLVFPQMPAAELLAYLAAEFGAASSGNTPALADSVRRISTAITDNASQGRHAIVAIDEAHLIEGTRTFETLRLLLNFESDGRPGLTLLLVGQPALLPMLQRMPQLDERLGMKCLLRPLTLEETVSYVEHRLTAAGARRAIFTSAALEAIYRLAHGTPRQINRLCDLALLVGFANEQQAIDESQVEAVAEELVSVSPE